jgi:hypothetical protein
MTTSKSQSDETYLRTSDVTCHTQSVLSFYGNTPLLLFGGVGHLARPCLIQNILRKYISCNTVHTGAPTLGVISLGCPGNLYSTVDVEIRFLLKIRILIPLPAQ